MTVIAAVILTGLSFVIIIAPFFRQEPHDSLSSVSERASDSLMKLDITHAMMKQLDSDYQSGILSEADYRALQNTYREEVPGVRHGKMPEKPADFDKEIENKVSRLRQKRPVNIADEIEDKIASLRQGKSADVADEIEDQISSLRRAKGRFCSQCGASHKPDARFCGQCGAKLG
jgi:ribosomal protein S27AE